MAGVKNKVYLHLVWTVKERAMLLTPEIREIIFRQIRAVGQREDCPVQAVGGVEDHVHVVVLFATTIAIADLAKKMKGSTSHLIGTHFPTLNFEWQGGYGVFPVMPNLLTKVIDYVNNQEEHHRENTLHKSLEEIG
jgi:putative transposase